MEANSESKKQEQGKQDGNSSVIDAFISALFASSQPTASPATPSVNGDGFPLPESTEEQMAKSECTSIPVKLESTPAVTDLASPALKATKREFILTEEVEAYTQLSRRRKTDPSPEREYGEGKSRESVGFSHENRNPYNQHIDQPQPHLYPQNQGQSSTPPSVRYREKAKIVTQRLPAQHGQSASVTHMLALKPVDWSKTTARSRMLIRNIPSTLNNWELLDHFSPYGEIVEVVIKNHIGFVQFIDVSSCQAAVCCENGKTIKGVLLKLEVCKTKPSFARRNDHSKPLANLIIWDQVPPGYIDHIRFKFEKASLPIAVSSMRNRSASDEDRIIRQKAHPGVIAVLNVEIKHEQQRTIDLRLLNAFGTSIHFDAYDSISLDDAITLIKEKSIANRPPPKSPPHFQGHSDTPAQTSPKEVHPPYHPSLDIAALQQLDVNTLAAIYDMVHVQLESALAQHQQSQQQQQTLYQTQTPYSLNPEVPVYQQFPQVTLSRSTPPPLSPTSFLGSAYSNSHHTHSPPHNLGSVNHESIPLSTEQLGNILSSLNSASKQ
ncbi:hypothetical protein BC941DRAFT_476265 [Chlamydoabsidia padenii]|nr:hypothetical protein BC941DRAFT_476265 [Chlamydoabsidia padenii]